MAQLSEFLPIVRPFLPAATLMAVLRASRTVARTFCKETKAYHFTFDSDDYALTDESRLATFTLPANTSIEMPVVVYEALSQVRFSGVKDAQNLSAHQKCHVEYPDKLRFSAAVAGELTGTLALIPTYDATEIPDELFERFHEYMRAGILANLYLMEGTAWFNPKMAEMYSTGFMQGLEKAADEVRGATAYHSSTAQYGGL